MIQSIAIFCGSSIGNDPFYRQIAEETGRYLAEQNIRLVYGGGKVGIMGALADAVLLHGGEVTGVIPTVLLEREIAHDSLTDLIVVDTMHERKETMMELADAFIALPGGPGTLEELFEVFTWNQIGLLQKPCGLLNVNGYFDLIEQLFTHMIEKKFMSADALQILSKEASISELITRLSDYVAPPLKQYKDNQSSTIMRGGNPS